MNAPLSRAVPPAATREVKPYHPTLVRGLAVLAKHILDIEMLRRLVDRADGEGFISDARLGKLIDTAGERFSPKIQAKRPEPRFGEAKVRYSHIAVATLLAIFEADAHKGGTGRGVARKVEGIRRRAMELAVLSFLGADARGDVSEDVYSFAFDDVVVIFRSATNKADVLAVIGKGDDYWEALSEENRRAVYTTLVWLGAGDMGERHNRSLGDLGAPVGI